MALPQTIPTFSGLPGLSLWFHSDVVLYSNLSLCFRTYFVVEFVIVFSDLFCCRICHCVFGLILFSNLSLCFRTLFSNLSLCFLTYCFVVEFVVVFSDLLFCFRICHCVF